MQLIPIGGEAVEDFVHRGFSEQSREVLSEEFR